jgi:serine/threonine protein kinase
MDPCPVFIMETYNATVAQLRKEGMIPYNAGLAIAAQIACALEYLHALFFAHHAVKSGNVVLLQRSLEDPISKLSSFSQCERAESRFDYASDIYGFLTVLLDLFVDDRRAVERIKANSKGFQNYQDKCEPGVVPLLSSCFAHVSEQPSAASLAGSFVALDMEYRSSRLTL